MGTNGSKDQQRASNALALHRPGIPVSLGCNNRSPCMRQLEFVNMFLTLLEAGKSRIKLLADSASGESQLFRLYLVAMSSHGGKAKKPLCNSFIRALILLMREPHS